MQTAIFRKKASLWEQIGYIVMMFLSLLFLFEFATSISQHGIARYLNDWLKPTIYAFVVITYVYCFWRFCRKLKSKSLATALAVVAACLCFVQILAYNSFLHLIPWAQCFDWEEYGYFEILLVYMRGDLEYGIGIGALRYPALFCAVLIPCLVIAIKTPAGICHLIHEVKMRVHLHAEENPATRRLTNLPSRFTIQGAFIEKATLDNKIFVSMQNTDGTVTESTQYTVLFEAVDHTDKRTHARYVAFYDASTYYDSEDNMVVYAARYSNDKKHPVLHPVDSQSMFDFMEAKRVYNWC